MPKEKVYDSSSLFDVEVGWSAGSSVQLGVESHSGQPLVELLQGSDFTGVWATLDRDGCNRLIRALRKARDAAYGRDE